MAERTDVPVMGPDVKGIAELYSTMKKYPKVLQNINEFQLVRTPLHAAVEDGNTTLALEIMTLMPSFGKKLNPEGLSPLHVAIEERKTHPEKAQQITNTAEALVKIDKQLVRVKGKEGQTPLHSAAKEEGSSDLLGCFLVACPDSINDLNNRFQTALHVALENKNHRGFRLLLNWLVRTVKIPVLGWKDGDGNTALHIAVQHGLIEEVKRILSLLPVVNVNKKNINGKTPMDMAEEEEMKNLLIKAGARKATLPTEQTQLDYLESDTTCSEYFVRGYVLLSNALTMDLRNVILVVAVLIVGSTYQGVLQPPGGGGVNQSDVPADINGSKMAGRAVLEIARTRRLLRDQLPQPRTGEVVVPKRYYTNFMVSNTLAFSISIAIIVFVLPFLLQTIFLYGCLLYICIGYHLALDFVSEPNCFSRNILIISGFVIGVTAVIKIYYYMITNPVLHGVWWVRRIFHVITALKAKIKFGGGMRKQFKLLTASYKED